MIRKKKTKFSVITDIWLTIKPYIILIAGAYTTYMVTKVSDKQNEIKATADSAVVKIDSSSFKAAKFRTRWDSLHKVTVTRDSLEHIRDSIADEKIDHLFQDNKRQDSLLNKIHK
jgi:hypothetical protein